MKNRFALVAVCVFLLAGCASKPTKVEPFTFIHCSDIHIGAGDNHVTDAALFREMSKLSPKPAFVVNTGDVCEYGTDEQYALYRKTLENLDPSIKMRVAPGNHDVRWNPRGKEGYTRGTNTPLYQSWDYENIHFVTLDSTVLLEHWGHISQEQLNWLRDDLKKVGTDKPIIIGFHHWVGRESVMMDNEQALLDLVKPYNVVLWLQGHGHADIDWNANGTPATMVGGLYQGSYDIISVTADELKITKRTAPKVKKAELLQGTDVPRDTIKQSLKPLMTIPLKKRPAPRWFATVRLDGDNIMIRVDAPKDNVLHGVGNEIATAEYRIDTEKPQPLVGQARVPITQLSPGEHVVTVQATLGDKRAYQQPVPITLPGKVAPLWSINVGGEVQSRLTRHGDLVLVSSMGNDLIALTAADGKEKFRVKTAGPIFSCCDVADGTIYFGSADHGIYAVNAADGSKKWKTDTEGAVLAGPAIAKGVVCVGSTDTKIYGLNAATGSIRWTVPGKNMFQSKTATDGERFFVGGWDNHFRCIDASTGKLLWDLELGRKQKYENFSAFAPAITAPAVGDGKVYVSTNDGILHSLNIADGSEAWHVDWKKMGYSSPLFHAGKVYGALSDEGKVFAVYAKTGKMLWQAETGSVIYDSSFCWTGGEQDGRVVIGCVNGTLTSINAATGKIDWQYRMAPGHLLGSPIGDDEHVYAGSMSGQVIALPARSAK